MEQTWWWQNVTFSVSTQNPASQYRSLNIFLCVRPKVDVTFYGEASFSTFLCLSLRCIVEQKCVRFATIALVGSCDEQARAWKHPLPPACFDRCLKKVEQHCIERIWSLHKKRTNVFTFTVAATTLQMPSWVNPQTEFARQVKKHSPVCHTSCRDFTRIVFWQM